MAVTSPDNIWTPDSGDEYALTVDLAAMADSIQDVFTGNGRIYKWANATARAAQTGMTEGDLGDQADTDEIYRYSGSAWQVIYGPSVVTPVAMNSGFTGELYHIRSGDVVTLSGRSIIRNVAWTNNTTIATLPANLRPPAQFSFASSSIFNSSTGGIAGLVAAAFNGNVTSWGQTSAAGNAIQFDCHWIMT